MEIAHTQVFQHLLSKHILSILIFLNIGRKTLVTPFKMKPEFYMYVWDQDRHTYQSVYDSWLIEIGKGN